MINQTQMSKGFARIRSKLDEEALDYGPKAKVVFQEVVRAGMEKGWLAADALAEE